MAQDVLTSAFVKMRSLLKTRARRILGSEAAADDALQEAFYKLWKRQYRLQTVSEAEALLSTAVRNTSLDEVRRRSRFPIDSTDKPWNDGGDRSGGMDVAVEELDREALYRKVDGLIESELTELQKLILRRRDYEGMDYAEIAEELGMNEAAVRMQLSRARKAIREQYRKMENE